MLLNKLVNLMKHCKAFREGGRVNFKIAQTLNRSIAILESEFKKPKNKALETCNVQLDNIIYRGFSQNLKITRWTCSNHSKRGGGGNKNIVKVNDYRFGQEVMEKMVWIFLKDYQILKKFYASWRFNFEKMWAPWILINSSLVRGEGYLLSI